MQITTREDNDVKIVTFEGNLDTNTSSDAQTTLSGLLTEGVQKILANCEKLDYISSAGLRVLLATAKQLNSAGGELRICSLNETVQEVFDISGFSTIFNVFATETEALNGF
jgi:anti-sigma B factor antagonist